MGKAHRQSIKGAYELVNGEPISPATGSHENGCALQVPVCEVGGREPDQRLAQPVVAAYRTMTRNRRSQVPSRGISVAPIQVDDRQARSRCNPIRILQQGQAAAQATG